MDSAPKTRRIRPRTIILVLAAIAVAWIGFEVVWWATSEPAEQIDYYAKAEALVSSHQPEGENGWPVLMEALERYQTAIASMPDVERTPRHELDDGSPVFDSITTGTFDAADYPPELEAIELMRTEGALEHLARLRGQTRFVRPMAGNAPPMFSTMLGELAPLRQLSKVRVAMMRIAAVEGDADEQVAALEDGLALARACGSQTFIIDRLVAMAVTSMMLAEARRQIGEGLVDAETARRMIDAIERQALPPADLMFEGERLGVLDAIQYCFTDDGHGSGRLKSDAFNSLTWGGGNPGVGVASFFLAGRKETTDRTNEFFDGLAGLAQLNAAERKDAEFDDGQFVANLTHRQVFLRTLLPAVGKALRQEDLMQVQRTATIVMLALEIHRLEHGAYPATLDALAPGILDAVPADPIHGGPFVYRLTPDGPQPYALYSTGADETDDGGVDAVPGQSRGNPLYDDGTDVTFYEERKPREDW